MAESAGKQRYAKWIGVDLDGTLAQHTDDKSKIGEPVPAMVERVKRWLSKGHRVKVFTARANDPANNELIQSWLRDHLGVTLEVTCNKDPGMIALFDDRAVRVDKDTGKLRTFAAGGLNDPEAVGWWLAPHGKHIPIKGSLHNVIEDDPRHHDIMLAGIPGIGKENPIGDALKLGYVRHRYGWSAGGDQANDVYMGVHKQHVKKMWRYMRPHVAEALKNRGTALVDIYGDGRDPLEHSHEIKNQQDLHAFKRTHGIDEATFAADDTSPQWQLLSASADALTAKVRTTPVALKNAMLQRATMAHYRAARAHGWQRQWWQQYPGEEAKLVHHSKQEKRHLDRAEQLKRNMTVPFKMQEFGAYVPRYDRHNQSNNRYWIHGDTGKFIPVGDGDHGVVARKQGWAPVDATNPSSSAKAISAGHIRVHAGDSHLSLDGSKDALRKHAATIRELIRQAKNRRSAVYLDVWDGKRLRDYEFSALSSTQRESAFRKLANAQRGTPERAMERLQMANIGQLYGWVAEHVGDLTHRMSEHPDYGHGYENVHDKVRKTLRALTVKPPQQMCFEDDHKQQVASNVQYHKEHGRDWHKTPEEAHAALAKLGQAYADAHRKLPVYNHAQHTAREAAIAVGEMRFDDARHHLRTLKRWLKRGPEHWNTIAGAYDPHFEKRHQFATGWTYRPGAFMKGPTRVERQPEPVDRWPSQRHVNDITESILHGASVAASRQWKYKPGAFKKGPVRVPPIVAPRMQVQSGKGPRTMPSTLTQSSATAWKLGLLAGTKRKRPALLDAIALHSDVFRRMNKAGFKTHALIHAKAAKRLLSQLPKEFSAEGPYGAWIDGFNGQQHDVYGPYIHGEVARKRWKTTPSGALARGHIHIVHADPDTNMPLVVSGTRKTLSKHFNHLSGLIGRALFKHRTGAMVEIHEQDGKVNQRVLTKGEHHEALRNELTGREFSAATSLSALANKTSRGVIDLAGHKAAYVAHRRAYERLVDRAGRHMEDVTYAKLANHHFRMMGKHERVIMKAERPGDYRQGPEFGAVSAGAHTYFNIGHAPAKGKKAPEAWWMPRGGKMRFKVIKGSPVKQAHADVNAIVQGRVDHDKKKISLVVDDMIYSPHIAAHHRKKAIDALIARHPGYRIHEETSGGAKEAIGLGMGY